MAPTLDKVRLFAIAAAAATVLATLSPAWAQTISPPASETTIRALQEALNKQGIAVSVDGVLNEETRAAIRKYQSQHHVPVTGEPDKATLDKLGVRESSIPAQSPALAQANPPASTAAPQTSPAQPAPGGGMMMDCAMMQGQMQGMMQMMQGMMQMMTRMSSGQSRPGPMQPGQMQPGPMPGAR